MNMNKEEKFQIKLAFIVFVLTIISSLMSGYFVYQLTADKEPYLFVNPYKYDPTNNTLLLQVANIKENPATMVRILYKIDGADQWETAETENGEQFIPYLQEGNSFVLLDFRKIEYQIVKQCENMLIANDAKEFDSIDLSQKKFNIVLKTECQTCNGNIFQPNELIYSLGIKCNYNSDHQVEHSLPSGIEVNYGIFYVKT